MNNNKSEKSKRFSYVGIHSNNNVSYAMQYKQAFDILYESPIQADLISMPMMFLMRHYLELILKSNIIMSPQNRTDLQLIFIPKRYNIKKDKI